MTAAATIGLVLLGTLAEPSDDAAVAQSLIQTHCLDCHTGREAERGLDLSTLATDADAFADPQLATNVWEHLLRRVQTRQMPPPDASSLDAGERDAAAAAIARLLDGHARAFPTTGRVGPIRRMTRAEYQNAIRDLLGVAIDAAAYLPQDQSSHGFDNITVEELSPTHLTRYLSAAQKIARAAVGGLGNGPVGVTIRIPADRSQEGHVAGLPLGTRGGTTFAHHFPQAGLYEFELKLTRDRDEMVEGLYREHRIDVLIDRDRRHAFTVRPPENLGNWNNRDFTHSDSHLKVRLPIAAGTHQVGVTFPMTAASLRQTKRQPFDASFNRHRHPRQTPAIFQVSIVGPFDAGGPGETQPRQLIFGEHPHGDDATRGDAAAILRDLARRAYRRPVADDDVTTLLAFFDAAREEGESFEQGIEAAVAAMLVNPHFLFRLERGQDSGDGSAIVPLTDHELASRLSFFLWSSIPDDRLLDLADAGTLSQEAVLRDETRRMLADDRAAALATNFAAQWLHLRNLASITPDLRLFPDFDDNLRHAFREETERLFLDVLRNDRPVTALIDSPYTFLNERLAVHYGIPGVTGSRFRRVDLPPDVPAAARRGGLLRHGGVLMVTSYATRTSPTIRGNWILENLLGTPAPPPPPDIPNLTEKSALAASTVRERLARHRADPACAGCHDLIDPVGFALENFDAVGRWRDRDGSLPIDSRGRLPDGTELDGLAELEAGLVADPRALAQTLTEKLMTYALGRAVGPSDAPAIRAILRETASTAPERKTSPKKYVLSSLIAGIVVSEPFRVRRAVDRRIAEAGP